MNAIKLLVVVLISLIIHSCKQSQSPDKKNTDQTGNNNAGKDSEAMSKAIDSITHYKSLRLTIDSVLSDVDELIPVGYNDNGSFAYFINENNGGASQVDFHISPVYEVFSVHSSFDMDLDLDSVISSHSAFIYHSLLAGRIRLTNQFGKLSLDSLGKAYGHKFDNKKNFGPADPDDGSGRRLLSSVLITYRRYDENTVEVINRKLPATSSIYDIYISDCISIPNRDGDLGFLVVVTESRGFEGHTRKSIEVVPIGVLETKE